MSNTPEVKLPVLCNRTNKTVEIKLPLDRVESFLSSSRAREEAAERIKEAFSVTAEIGSASPDLVVYYKGALVVLATVLDKHDGAVLRMLHEATQSDVFPKPPTRHRKLKDPDISTGNAKKTRSNGKSASDSVVAPAE